MRFFFQSARQGKTHALYEQGRVAATKFLAGNPTQEEIGRNYGYSRAAPDQTGFDKGWREVLRPRIYGRRSDAG